MPSDPTSKLCSTKQAAHWINGVSYELIKILIAVNMVAWYA